VGNELGVDVALAHPSSDELRVLSAEIDDQNPVHDPEYRAPSGPPWFS
jgi:hypothetical protein